MNKTVRNISYQLHLWIGLISGVVVFIVCVTGCFYVFKDEIKDLTEPWRFVKSENKSIKTPSQVIDIASQKITDKKPSAITYGESTDAVMVDYFDRKTGMSTIFINPYSGEVIKTVIKKQDEFDFFSFILNGHRTLWLPREIGKPIVGWGVVLFVVTLITGIVLWWPKKWNRKSVKKILRIRKRNINFDLHNVLGGYFTLVLLIIALTGLIWSFDWFSKSVYTLTGGGELKPYKLPASDTINIHNGLINPLDKLYTQLREKEPNAKTFYFALPYDEKGVIRVSVVHKRDSYYQTDNLFFDQYTLKPLEGQGPYAGKYTEVSTADKIRRMNLEIHDGRILGLFGKIIAFFASLIGASLPVTGFIIWYRKRRKKKSKKLKRNN